MKLNAIERAVVDNPMRRLVQRVYETPLLLSMGRPVAGGDALEIGCGQGYGLELILEQFGASRVMGIDLDARMVRLAEKRAARFGERITVVEGDATQLPLRDCSFDAVFDFGIVHHVPAWRDAIREVARVLKPGGIFYFEEVSRQALDRWVYRALFEHPKEDRFTMTEFARELERNGIDVGERVRSFWFGDFFAGVGYRSGSGAVH